MPSLLSGAAGMTYEKGTSEVYGKQVYEHYLAINATIDVTARTSRRSCAAGSSSGRRPSARARGATSSPTSWSSPLTEPLKQQPAYDVCGYFFRPDRHEGDTAALVEAHAGTGRARLHARHDVNAAGVREFGTGTSGVQALPKGTLYMPMNQPLKHWIQAVMGEDPFEPIEFFYDVATWSYPMHRGLAGSGFLTSQLPPGTMMTEIGDPGLGSLAGGGKPVLAFETDSMQALALVYELLDKGVDVARAGDPFTRRRPDVHAPAARSSTRRTLGSVDIAALAAKRQTPVTGIDGYPVAHTR